MGYEPKYLNRAAGEAHLAGTKEATEFLRRTELIERALRVGRLTDPILPSKFTEWAHECELTLPDDLLALKMRWNTSANPADLRIRELENTVSLLEQRCADQERKLAEPNTRRLGSYQRTLLSLALKDYGYRPEDARNSAAGTIASRTGNGRLRVSTDTVRSCLREAVEDLGYDTAQDKMDEDEIPRS